MLLYISKLLQYFINPLTVSLILLVVAIILFARKRQKAGYTFLLISIFILWFSSLPVGANFLRGSLERNYLPIPVEEYPEVDAIIVLGGAVGSRLPPRIYPDLSSASDRILHAFRLYRARKARLVILAGGNISWSGVKESEASVMAVLLKEWGVPEKAILLEEKSTTTLENAEHAGKLLEKYKVKKALLVTSASHMPRAMIAFKNRGVEMIPAPTDFEIIDKPTKTVFDFLPDAGALANTSQTFKELAGILLYKTIIWWRGTFS